MSSWTGAYATWSVNIYTRTYPTGSCPSGSCSAAPIAAAHLCSCCYSLLLLLNSAAHSLLASSLSLPVTAGWNPQAHSIENRVKLWDQVHKILTNVTGELLPNLTCELHRGGTKEPWGASAAAAEARGVRGAQGVDDVTAAYEGLAATGGVGPGAESVSELRPEMIPATKGAGVGVDRAPAGSGMGVVRG
jgi:hypothetical protein